MNPEEFRRLYLGFDETSPGYCHIHIPQRALPEQTYEELDWDQKKLQGMLAREGLASLFVSLQILKYQVRIWYEKHDQDADVWEIRDFGTLPPGKKFAKDGPET